ncbi:MAG: family 1 glycosylhydrolase [Chloroflexi bacterium]|nr:family 1 glycosylhydrolase [Chloroflexota bacterium]
MEKIAGSEYTEMGWEVCAPALRRMLVKINNEYRLPPIYITENDAAFEDKIGADGKIHDPRRIEYLKNHFIQTRLAMQDGVDVRGYMVWSLMDNFEWGHVLSKRFGLTYIDYAMLCCKDVIASRCKRRSNPRADIHSVTRNCP